MDAREVGTMERADSTTVPFTLPREEFPAETLPRGLEREGGSSRRYVPLSTRTKIIGAAATLAVLSWGFEALFHYVVLGERSLLGSLLFSPSLHEVYTRVSMMILFLLAGFFTAEHVKKREEAEKALRKSKEELETKVDERTRELRELNNELQRELEEHRKTEKALQESENRLWLLSFQVLNAHETERRRISRELHDDLGQALAILKVRLATSIKKRPPGQEKSQEDWEGILSLIDEIIENVRRLSRGLHPQVLEHFGFGVALRRLLDDFSKHYGVTLHVEIPEFELPFPRDSELMIYRILQEALHNIGKHAQATHASLKVSAEDHCITFVLQDDGRGFDINDTIISDGTGKGLGLAIMAERVRMLGGTFGIRSAKGRGTRITFSIPVLGGDTHGAVSDRDRR